MDFFLGFDFSILDFIANNIRNDFLDPIMAFFSLAAENGIGLVMLSLILLIPRKTRPAAVAALCALTVCLVLGEGVIKHIVLRPRPFDTYYNFHHAKIPINLNIGKVWGYSFPSMHTCCSFACATIFFKINQTVGIVSIVIAATVGFSRLYNYVHFPTDVIAGMILGIGIGLLTILIFNKYCLDEKILKIGNKKQNSLKNKTS